MVVNLVKETVKGCFVLHYLTLHHRIKSCKREALSISITISGQVKICKIQSLFIFILKISEHCAEAYLEKKNIRGESLDLKRTMPYTFHASSSEADGLPNKLATSKKKKTV